MAVPTRNSDPHGILQSRRTFFVTTRTYMGRRLFQVDRNAELLVDVLRACAARFRIHDFVVMPEHVHLLLSVEGDLSVEKAMQFIKGGFSYRIKKELRYAGEVWQRGFSEVRVNDDESFRSYREYIAQNPVQAGLVASAEMYRWCFESLKRRKAQGLKPSSNGALCGTTKVMP